MTRHHRPPAAGVVDERLRARMRDAVTGLDERLQALQDDWDNHAEPRRPQLGHSPNCPNLGRPMRRCGWCRAEFLGRKTDPAPPKPPPAPDEPPPLAQLRACTSCYRPTDHPSVLCERCQPGGTT